jgi:hypothetical protein
MTEEDARAVVNDYLKGAMTTLRQHFARRLKEQRAEDPGLRLPCDTCAFRTNTDGMEGFDRTAIGFITALVQPNGFFACHLPRKAGEQYFPLPRFDEEGGVAGFVPCAAFEVLTAEPPLDPHAVLGPVADGLAAVYTGCKLPDWVGE